MRKQRADTNWVQFTDEAWKEAHRERRARGGCVRVRADDLISSTGEYDFSGLSDLDLIVMQHEARQYPEDEEFVKAVLLEISKRQKGKRQR